VRTRSDRAQEALPIEPDHGAAFSKGWWSVPERYLVADADEVRDVGHIPAVLEHLLHGGRLVHESTSMLQNLARHDDELLASHSSEKFACI
jgi:hypothetical protein